MTQEENASPPGDLAVFANFFDNAVHEFLLRSTSALAIPMLVGRHLQLSELVLVLLGVHLFPIHQLLLVGRCVDSPFKGSSGTVASFVQRNRAHHGHIPGLGDLLATICALQQGSRFVVETIA